MTHVRKLETVKKIFRGREGGKYRGRKLENTYKGKAIPVQSWTGPEGSRSLRIPDFKTIGT